MVNEACPSRIASQICFETTDTMCIRLFTSLLLKVSNCECFYEVNKETALV